MLPPNVNVDWEENPSWLQALLIAYNQVRTVEESKTEAYLAALLGTKK